MIASPVYRIERLSAKLISKCNTLKCILNQFSVPFQNKIYVCLTDLSYVLLSTKIQVLF